MSDPINQTALYLIMRNEGYRSEAYQDSVGVWTIGYGHTGPDVYEGLSITEEEGKELLMRDLEKFQDGVDELLDVDADTSDNEFGAMVSLAFNIGLGNFAKSSVLRKHNAGDKRGAAAAFMLWDRAGGKELFGLLRRRREESNLYLTPDPEAKS